MGLRLERDPLSLFFLVCVCDLCKTIVTAALPFSKVGGMIVLLSIEAKSFVQAKR